MSETWRQRRAAAAKTPVMLNLRQLDMLALYLAGSDKAGGRDLRTALRALQRAKERREAAYDRASRQRAA